jgi:maltose alpha-D-glucosyltransferase/alpha-amylase
MYRAPEEGKNPELEIIQALSENATAEFKNFPIYSGALEYRSAKGEKASLGILVDFVPNQGNAWDFAQNSMEHFFDEIRSRREDLMEGYTEKSGDILKFIGKEKEKELFDPFFIEMIELLGKRTAEMHLALASVKGKADFKEEPFSLLYQKSLYQSFRTLLKRTVSQMKSSRKRLDEKQKALIDEILQNENILLSTIKKALEKDKIDTTKIRVHGDYHLGQVLFTGKDFIIIDFEGEPTRSLTARSLRYCPFKDIAGMLRSFHYAIYMGQFEYLKKDPESSAFTTPWLEPWYRKVKDIYLESYLKRAGKASFVPSDRKQLDDLLSVYTIEKAIYEADYELNNRPDWLHIPLNGLTKILNDLINQ